MIFGWTTCLTCETLQQVGLDFVMPCCEGRHRDRETMALEKVIQYLSPLKV